MSFVGKYIIDAVRGDMWIGCNKNRDDHITSWWHGYIYNFDMCLKIHDTSDDSFQTGGCVINECCE